MKINRIKSKIKDKIERFKLKQEILLAKGLLAEIYKKSDWTDIGLTTEEQLKVRALLTQIIIAEDALNSR